jgi:D-arabinose 1-dehydrogenase-like Zn-dependent alcohol dehydrogenase
MAAKDKMEAVVKCEGTEGGTEFREVDVPKVGYSDVLIKIKIARRSCRDRERC